MLQGFLDQLVSGEINIILQGVLRLIDLGQICCFPKGYQLEPNLGQTLS